MYIYILYVCVCIYIYILCVCVCVCVCVRVCIYIHTYIYIYIGRPIFFVGGYYAAADFNEEKGSWHVAEGTLTLDSHSFNDDDA